MIHYFLWQCLMLQIKLCSIMSSVYVWNNVNCLNANSSFKHWGKKLLGTLIKRNFDQHAFTQKVYICTNLNKCKKQKKKKLWLSVTTVSWNKLFQRTALYMVLWTLTPMRDYGLVQLGLKYVFSRACYMWSSCVRKALNTLIIFLQPRDFAVQWLAAIEILWLLCFLNWQTLLQLTFHCRSYILKEKACVMNDCFFSCNVIFLKELCKMAAMRGTEALKRELTVGVTVTHLCNVQCVGTSSAIALTTLLGWVVLVSIQFFTHINVHTEFLYPLLCAALIHRIRLESRSSLPPIARKLNDFLLMYLTLNFEYLHFPPLSC